MKLNPKYFNKDGTQKGNDHRGVKKCIKCEIIVCARCLKSDYYFKGIEDLITEEDICFEPCSLEIVEEIWGKQDY